MARVLYDYDAVSTPTKEPVPADEEATPTPEVEKPARCRLLLNLHLCSIISGSGRAYPASVHYQKCAAVRAAGAAPLYAEQLAYASHLDGDGVACENLAVKKGKLRKIFNVVQILLFILQKGAMRLIQK